MTDNPNHGRFSKDRNWNPIEGHEDWVLLKDLPHLYDGHRNSKHRHDGHGRHEDNISQSNKSSFASDARIAAQIGNGGESFFFIDRKGDSQNVVYGGNARGAIPRYHTCGYGSLIGADRRYKVSADGSKALGDAFTIDGPRKGHAKSLLTFRDNPALVLDAVVPEVIENDDDGVKLQHGYIPVGAKRRKRGTSQVAAVKASDMTISQPKNDEDKQASDSDSDTHTQRSSDEDPDAYDTFCNDVHRKRLLELNRATRERPAEVDVWLDLISHQALASRMGAIKHVGSLSATDERNLAEMRLALYEKALMKVTEPASKEILVLGLMNQAALIWDAETVRKKWRAVLNASSSITLWIRYLDFRQSDSATFAYEECLSIHGKCLERASEGKDLRIRDELSIYVLLRTTTFMSQCGYLERSTAIWQALLEYAFFRPEPSKQSDDHASFRAFWESEMPRVGGENATSWTLSEVTNFLPKADALPILSNSKDCYESWVLREQEVARRSIMPARTLDEVADDDPYRTILFSDISKFLFRPITNDGYALLLNAFLHFCGLPALHRPGLEAYRKWWLDPLLIVNVDQEHLPAGEETSITDAVLSLQKHHLTAFSHVTSTRKTMQLGWLRKLLTQLVDAFVNDEILAEYVVVFEASLDVKGARKYAKTLLKTRPTSFKLYNAYALLECRLDRFESAEHIWSTAISMSSDQNDVTLLWDSWLWECLHRGNLSRAQHILLSIPEGRLYEARPDFFGNTASRIRIKNHLESRLAQQMSLSREDAVLHITELLAVYEYLMSSQTLAPALAVYGTTLESAARMTASSIVIERLHQSRARLLHLHPSLSHGHKPSEVNRYLVESLQAFPENSMFNQLHQEHVQRSGLLERIREVIPMKKSPGHIQNIDSSIISLLFSIRSEMARPSYAGSTNHSIRAAFERSIGAAKSCVGIWSWFVRWEASLESRSTVTAESQQPRKRDEQLPRNKAVEVYYRAIRACPWSKPLSMLAFSETTLRNAIGDVELRKIYDIMCNKGLRLHVSLDLDPAMA